MKRKNEIEVTSNQSKMATLLADTAFAPKAFSRGEAVEGKVVAVLRDSLLVDIGAKAEGIIPLKELEEEGKIAVGDKISAIVAQPEGDSGVAILTVKKPPREKAWEDLQRISEQDGTMEVRGVDSNRGGLIVEVDKLRGFVPASHLITNVKEAIGRPLSVKIIEINKSLNKLVFSEKEATGGNLPKIELPFEVGETLGVKITKILPFGLLVSLPSATEGLIHISEISWKRVGPLEENFKVDQELEAKVISVDSTNGRVNLSLKQLLEDPWQKAAKKYPVGTILEGQVTRAVSYGVFVGLEEGIEGLLHSSKIPYGVALKEGDKLKVSVDLFNVGQRRVALRLATEATETQSKAEATKEEKEKVTQNKKVTKETKETKATTVRKPTRNASPARKDSVSGERSEEGGAIKERKATKGTKVTKAKKETG
jgi:small subunit ribosomal protein S1